MSTDPDEMTIFNSFYVKVKHCEPCGDECYSGDCRPGETSGDVWECTCDPDMTCHWNQKCEDRDSDEICDPNVCENAGPDSSYCNGGCRSDCGDLCMPGGPCLELVDTEIEPVDLPASWRSPRAAGNVPESFHAGGFKGPLLP